MKMERKQLSNDSYTNAFECHNCPKSTDGCPAWVEYEERNNVTKEERVVVGCFLVLALPLVLENTSRSINAASTSAQARDASRAHAEGVGRIMDPLSQVLGQLGERLGGIEQRLDQVVEVRPIEGLNVRTLPPGEVTEEGGR